MIEIIPAVLPKNYEDLKNKIALVRGVAPIAQIDICDGNFVKNITWPYPNDDHFNRILNEQEGLPFWEDIDFELDLMVANAVENFDIYTKLGARRLVFHIEAVGNLESFRDFLEGIDTYVRDVVEIGVAISPTTPVEQIFPLVTYVDFVQVMGIDHEGFQGEEFDERCLDHIKTLHEKYPDLVISVDGAVDFETAPALVSAGASRLVSGSAIWNSDDIISTIEQFQNL
jgi:ribulose-phosphate 3-epimerase